MPSEKPVKRVMTDKQKAARLLNLEKGRKTRMEKLQKSKEPQNEEYDLSSQSSDSSDSESDNEAFVISRKKKVVPKDVVINQQKSKNGRSHASIIGENPPNNFASKNDIETLKEAILDLHKKQNKAFAKSKTKRSGGGTKIVLLPQNTSQSNRGPNDSVIDQLRKSLM